MALGRFRGTPEARRFWESVEKAAAEVAKWPAWKRLEKEDPNMTKETPAPLKFGFGHNEEEHEMIGTGDHNFRARYWFDHVSVFIEGQLTLEMTTPELEKYQAESYELAKKMMQAAYEVYLENRGK